ncbi:hypothetical protein A3710_01185 [Stutzerimonas frequens]|nr:hypothetical protein A3710_01185 [Stutzerimonas frequens]
MLRGDAADHCCIAEVGTPQRLQRFDFVGQLVQVLVDELGLAAGAGGAERQAEQLGIELCRGEWRSQEVRQAAVARLIGQPELHVRPQPRAARGLQIGWQ